MTLPFGKYSGRDLEDVPLSYLAWLFEEVEIKSRALRRAIVAEIADRIGAPFDAYNEPYRPPAPPLVAALIAAGFRQLASRHHPDHGGNHHQMIATTAARDWLVQQVEQHAEVA